jgi:hypothetical protein
MVEAWEPRDIECLSRATVTHILLSRCKRDLLQWLAHAGSVLATAASSPPRKVALTKEFEQAGYHNLSSKYFRV